MRAITIFGEVVGVGTWIIGSAILFVTGISRLDDGKGSPGWNRAMVAAALLMMALFFTVAILLVQWIVS